MSLEERINYDMTELHKYYATISGSISSEPDWSYFSTSIRFNMVTDIFCCLEFWLNNLCDYHKSKNNLDLSHKDIRGNDSLHAYSKYLEKVAAIDMAPVTKAYCQLQSLRKVRNIIIHSGGHTEDDKLENISGIHLYGTLLLISEVFVNDSLISAKNYLLHVANA